MKKRIISGILTCMMLFCLCPVTGFAANTAKYNVPNQTVSTGEEFSLDVAVVNNPGIITLRFEVEYDSTHLTLLSVENKALFQGYTAPSPTITSPYTLRWADSLATVNNTANGTVCTLHFRALAPGNASVKINHAEARNVNGQKVSFADAVSVVSVETLSFCDLNGDKTMDARDMQCLYTYLSTGENEGKLTDDALAKAADINGDHSVDILDYQVLYEMIK